MKCLCSAARTPEQRVRRIWRLIVAFTKKCRGDRKQVCGGATFARASVGGFLQPLSALPMWWFLQLLWCGGFCSSCWFHCDCFCARKYERLGWSVFCACPLRALCALPRPDSQNKLEQLRKLRRLGFLGLLEVARSDDSEEQNIPQSLKHLKHIRSLGRRLRTLKLAWGLLQL
jgi:hypothetical protein